MGARSSDRFRLDEVIISRKARSWATGAVRNGAESPRSSRLADAAGKGAVGSLGLPWLFLSRVDLVRVKSPKGLGLGVFLAEVGAEAEVGS